MVRKAPRTPDRTHRRRDRHSRDLAPPGGGGDPGQGEPKLRKNRPDRPAGRPKAARAAGAGDWIWGRHAVVAALGNPARLCKRLVATPEAAEALSLETRPGMEDGQGPALEIIARPEIEALLPPGAIHQGVALRALPLPPVSLGEILPPEAVAPPGSAPIRIVLLDQVTDPQNLGTILRTAAAFGARAVVVPKRHAPELTGAVIKAASGAVEKLALVRVANLAAALAELKDHGFWTVGLDARAEDRIDRFDFPARTALVLGSEGGGLRRLTRENCDYLAHIPFSGEMESLNVAAAAAIALYAASTRPAA